MDAFVKVAAVALVACVLTVLIKKHAPETALMLALSASAVILAVFLNLFSGVRDFIVSLAETAGLSSAVMTPLVKTIAVAIVCRLACEVCRDASQNALAASVEIVGAVTALYIALPLMSTAVEMISSLV